MPIDPSKVSYCFQTSIAISLTLHDFLLLLHSNRTICCIFSYQHSLLIISWRDISQSWRQRELTGIHFNLKLRHYMRSRWIVIFDLDYIFVCLKLFWWWKRGVVKAVIYGCMRCLDGRIPDCKLVMHTIFFHEIQQSIILDLCSMQVPRNNGLDRLKSCCHHRLKDLCVHTDGTWCKKKKYSHWKDVGNYPDGCIICLKSFSVGCVSLAKMGNDCIVCSLCYNLCSLHYFISY